MHDSVSRVHFVLFICIELLKNWVVYLKLEYSQLLKKDSAHMFVYWHIFTKITWDVIHFNFDLDKVYK